MIIQGRSAQRWPLFLIGLFSMLAGKSQDLPSGTPPFIRDSLDAYISRGLKDWQVPGLAVVVVKDGRVVLMKGYGVRDMETKKKVDAGTLFMIASNTKLFTGCSLAMLDEQGKISLDDPITKYFPEFRLYDSTSTGLVSIRDLLCHRIGTKTYEGDFTFWNTALTREEIMHRMRYLKPVYPFRQVYGYCNSCFLTAGQVIPVVTGTSWEEFVQSHFLTPLGMNQSRVLSTGIASQANVATPYTTSYTGNLEKVPYDNWNNMAPAASIVSNVQDLSHWLMMQLDSGRYEGKQIISWKSLAKTRWANTWISSILSPTLPMHFRGYGLGLVTNDYAGRQIFYHTGGAGGMVSNVCFVPEEKLGIAILTNNDNQNFFEALRYQILDAYLGQPYVNRSLQRLPDHLESDQKTLAAIRGWKSRLHKERPVMPLSAYAGEYRNTLYGKIRITVEADHLLIRFETKPDLSATLEYMGNDEWLLTYNNILYGIFSTRFEISGEKVTAVTTKENPFVEEDPYRFEKVN